MGDDPLQSYREATRSHQPHGWRKHVTRRKVLAGGVTAGGMVWSAPAVYAWCKPTPPGSCPTDHHIKYLCLVLIWAKYKWARFGCLWDSEEKKWVPPTMTDPWVESHCLTQTWGWIKCTTELVTYLNQNCRVDKVGDGETAEYQLTFLSTSGLAMADGWARNGPDNSAHCNPAYGLGTGYRFRPYMEQFDKCVKPTTTTSKATSTTQKGTTTTYKATTTTQKATTTTYKATTTTQKATTTTQKATTTTVKPTTTTIKKATTTTYRHY